MNEKKVSYFSDYNYNDLIFNYERSNNRGNSVKYYTKQIITLDTETTKYTDDILFVVDWSITIQNNITVYGHRIQDLVYTLKQILNQAIVNDNIICPVYIHNLSYDYMFLRNHLFNTFGKPINSLATKTHKYIFLKFENGLELRDSYILTQKSLEKLAKDMNVTNKAIGTYDYDKFRTPLSDRSEEEINYFVTDTISLNESLVKFFEQREVTNATTQYTSTGFIREKGYQYMYRDFREWNKKGFREQRLSLEHYKILLDCYHGGYTHANRYFIDTVLNDIICYDITSSYPSVICYEKFPMSKFAECDNIEYSTILKTCEDFAYCGYLEVINCRVKKLFPMPTIQQHKVLFERNALYDNGKLITADMVIFPFSDPDLFSFELAYDYDIVKVGKCIFTKKDFLPDFLTRSLIGELFYNKCTLKGIDDTNYMISKTYINGVYGMMVQKIIPDECTENFDTGEWKVDSVLKDKEKAEKTLDKFYKHHKKYLEYQWGVYVTQ